MRSDRPIKQVADLGGFQNRQYFNTVFKTRQGVTPAQYRRRVLH